MPRPPPRSTHCLPGWVLVWAALALAIPSWGRASEAGADTAAAETDSSGLPGSSVNEEPGAIVNVPGAATRQTRDMVRWVSRRSQFRIRGIDYGVTGLPIVYYSPNTGLNYGGRLQWADYRRRPYRYKLTMYWVNSTEGRFTYYYKLKVPKISGTGFGVRLLIGTSRDIRARYYGLGNDSERDTDLTTAGSDFFLDENYYCYVLDKPQFVFSLLREIYGPVGMSVGFGLERTDVQKRGDVAWYDEDPTLENEGTVDGVTGFASVTLNWDTRDDPTIPRRGCFHEWSYQTSSNFMLGLLFEQIDFRRYTVTDARYFPVGERLNLANRIMFEALKGEVPLYAYGEIGGSRRVKGLGGGDTLRGYDRQRFTDNIRIATNTELRCHLRTWQPLRQYLEWHGVLFVDSGQVAPGVREMRPLDSHFTGGVGLRLYWDDDFVIRYDTGFSTEQVYLGLKYRNVF